MANSRVGQYQLEYMIEGFTAPNRAHAHRAYVNPTAPVTIGTPFGDIDFQARGGGSMDAVIAANNYWEFLRPLYNNSISCASVTLWRYVTNTSRDFVSAIALTNPLCTGGAPQPAQQVTLTFRTATSATMKLVYLEPNQSGLNTVPLVANPAGNVFQRIAAHVMSASGVFVGIDNNFPVTPMRDSRGQNELVGRLLYR